MLDEHMYDSSVAGYSAKASKTGSGLDIQIAGYDQKAFKVLEELLNFIQNFTFTEKTKGIDQEKIDSHLDQMVKNLKNSLLNQPYQLAMGQVSKLLSTNTLTVEEKLEFIEKTRTNSKDSDTFQLKEMDNFKKNHMVKNKLNVKMLISGNESLKNSEKAYNIIDNWLNSMVDDASDEKQKIVFVPTSKLNSNQSIILPKPSIFKCKSPVHDNSAINLVYVAGEKSLYNRTVSQIFAQLISEKISSSLRTKQQLGYIVHGGMYASNRSIGIQIIIQSAKNPYFLQYKIEEFWRQELKDFLFNELSEETLEKVKQAVTMVRLLKNGPSFFTIFTQVPNLYKNLITNK